MKNYMKDGQKLPLFGIGPFLVYGIGILTAAAIVLSGYVFRIGTLDGVWGWVFRIAGAILIVLGCVIWFIGAMCS